MYEKRVKRILDVTLSLILLPIVVLVILICGVFIKLEDGGPILYCGDRLGRYGKAFRIYKLRSMTVGAPDLRNPDGSTYNSQDDPRVTRVGRKLRETSLDELPQIINVLRGDMSLIGPRPDTPEALNSYNEVGKRKLHVRPGITGFSQAYYRNAISPREKLKNDVFYVDNMSFCLDMRILGKTLVSLLRQENVYSIDHMTADK